MKAVYLVIRIERNDEEIIKATFCLADAKYNVIETLSTMWSMPYEDLGDFLKRTDPTANDLKKIYKVN